MNVAGNIFAGDTNVGTGAATTVTAGSTTVTQAAWDYLREATGADLQGLWGTAQKLQGKGYQGPYSPEAYQAAPDANAAAFLSQQLPVYMPQLILHTLQQQSVQSGVQMNAAQQAAIINAVQNNPQLIQLATQQFSEWMTDTSKSYQSPAGLGTKLMAVVSNYGSLGAALGPDAAASLGLSSAAIAGGCLLYTSPSPRDLSTSRMPSSA